MQRGKLEAAHRPVSSEAVIRYDGKTWHFKRTHRYDAGKVDVWSIDLVVSSPKFHVEKNGATTASVPMRSQPTILWGIDPVSTGGFFGAVVIFDCARACSRALDVGLTIILLVSADPPCRY